jgi:hypothetical protein
LTGRPGARAVPFGCGPGQLCEILPGLPVWAKRGAMFQEVMPAMGRFSWRSCKSKKSHKSNKSCKSHKSHKRHKRCGC